MAVHHDHHHHHDGTPRENTLEGLAVFAVGFVFLVIVSAIAWWLAHTFH